MATWLGYTNAGLNCIIYSLLNKKYRRICIKSLRAWQAKRKHRHKYGLQNLKNFSKISVSLAVNQYQSTHIETENNK